MDQPANTIPTAMNGIHERTTGAARTRAAVAALVVLGSMAGLQGADPAPAQIEFFESRIRPVLASDCYECHGTEQQRGGLRLDSRDGLLEGGDSGPAIIAGDAAASLLIASITHADATLRMPKDRAPLADAVIADLIAWINDGAADPRDHPPVAGETDPADWEAMMRIRREWWSFQPLQRSEPPAVQDPADSAHPVDRFLMEKLRENDLEFAAPADPRSLLRRLTFALHGLPPTVEEVEAFVADDSPDAFGRALDRLLDSPRFGERWARHWMDLMRFAETHGSEGDPEIPHAWRYRDYLVRAMNADVSWDHLIREHIAGDLLPEPRRNEADGINESIIGPAHLRLVEHGFQPVDTLDEQVKTVDSQIDVISKAFQGLTISCARCHDHKFDPISHRDYYALYGVLASTRPGHVVIDLPERLRVHRQEMDALKGEVRTTLAAAWERSADDLARYLLAAPGAAESVFEPLPGAERHREIAELEARVAGIERAASRSAEVGEDNPAAPLAVWSFDGDADDSVGVLSGELLGGAVIRNGRLVLDGKGAYLRSAPLARPLREKTLEVWATVADTAQRGGGLLTVESADGSVFNAIVFGEERPRQWMAGSELFSRTRHVGGADETAAPDETLHLAITYREDGSIAIFRNGESYGASYTPEGEHGKPRQFQENSARVLIGMRHSGGSNGFFAGEIEEARLHGRALAADEVADSFRQGPGWPSAAEAERLLTPEQRRDRDTLLARIATLRASFVQEFPHFAEREAARTRWLAALEQAAADPAHPLHLWRQLGDGSAATWRDAVTARTTAATAAQQQNDERFTVAWEIGRDQEEPWFMLGVNPPEALLHHGGFAITAEGPRAIGPLLPAGVFSHSLSEKHNGIFMSPRFTLEHDHISVLVVGGKGARVRLIPDHYPLGTDAIFPQATLNSDTPTWVRLNVAYRKGTSAYLEFVTAADSLSRGRATPGPDGRSYFGVSKVVFHQQNAVPAPVVGAGAFGLSGDPPTSPDELAARFRQHLGEAIDAWRDMTLDEDRHGFLEAFVGSGLLPTTLDELPELAPLIEEYRRLEAAIPEPQRAPGVLETRPLDAPLLARGDHLQPQAAVPRGYLELISATPYPADQSGRLELAADLTHPDNPLTSRVMVNRIWHHLFGRGLVRTVDNFGRLGDTPTHPELLDYLATVFAEQNWSPKEMIRFLVSSQAWQASSEVSPQARAVDAANALLSHARVRRLEAEAIRDSLLAIGGRLDLAMHGPGANALAGPADQRRRSLYLTIRRNALNPFLDVFDAPRPFGTLGQRDATNIPGQSLALLNDPFVIEQASHWAAAVIAREEDPAARADLMFRTALARPPTAAERTAIDAYLEDIAAEHGDHGPAIWRDFAQSIFNLKEFIYLK